MVVAELNQFPTPRSYKIKRQSSSEKCGHLKKIMVCYFSASKIMECGVFEGGSRQGLREKFLQGL